MRGEGNHKIPGSFAPENMEKTGAERVKYSLACQYEDAIPIKFVSYVQKCSTVLCTFAVALRKESVDRQRCCAISCITEGSSLSARRAWIEKPKKFNRPPPLTVALRKESVDRKHRTVNIQRPTTKSLSARRAWIENSCSGCFRFSRLSLSARRAWIENVQLQNVCVYRFCRSPQGERG